MIMTYLAVLLYPFVYKAKTARHFRINNYKTTQDIKIIRYNLRLLWKNSGMRKITIPKTAVTFTLNVSKDYLTTIDIIPT